MPETPLDILERRLGLPPVREARDISHRDTPLGILEQRIGPAQGQNALQETGLHETEEGGTLWKILDFLQKGQYATVGAAEAARRGGDISAGFWAGLRGETKGSWVHIIEDLVPGRHPWVEKPLGFAGDVVLDPLNLLPMGWVSKVSRLLKLPRFTSALGKVAFVDRQMRRFKPGWALRDVNIWRLGDDIVAEGTPGAVRENAYEVYRSLQEELGAIRRTTQEELRARLVEFNKVAKRLGEDPRVAEAELIRLRELGLDDLVKADYREFYDDVVAGLEKLKEKEIAAGILHPDKVIEGYFPHIFEFTERGTFFTKLAIRTQPFFAKAREFKTIQEAKRVIEGWRKKGYAKDWAPVEDFFRGYAIRSYVSDSVFAWRGFVDKILTDYGTSFREVLERHVGKELWDLTPDDLAKLARDPLKLTKGQSIVMRVPNLRAPAMVGMELKAVKEALQEIPTSPLFSRMQSKMRDALIELPFSTAMKIGAKKPKFDMYFLPSELAHEVKKTFKVFTNEETVRGFFRSYDQVLHGWKSMATSLRVPFHSRNALSNFWLMYLGGVKVADMPKRTFQAMRIQMKAGEYFGKHGETMLALADRYGARGYGWLASDVPTMFHKEMRLIQEAPTTYRWGGTGRPLTAPSLPGMGRLARAGRRAGTFVEDNARIALWIDRMEAMGAKAGMGEKAFRDTASRAATHMKRYMFDYTELTHFERTVMKRIFPFYTWMRKNIPLQIASVVEQPWKYARLAKFHQDIGPLALGDPSETPTEKYLKPEYMREMKYIPTRWYDDAGSRVYTHFDLPTEELTKMWSLKNWLGALTPAKALYDILANVMTFPTEQQIKKFPGQRVPAPFWAAWVPEKLGKFADVGPTVYSRTGEVVVGMDPLWRYGLEQAFPFLNEWSRRFPQRGAMTVEDKATGKWKTLSYFTGIKWRPLDVKKEAIRKHFRIQEARGAVKKIMRSRAGKVTREEVLRYLEEMLD